jgi:PAS domain S-box-containing protein
MNGHSDGSPDWERQREKIIGLGELSIRKNYYPELQERIAELAHKNALLKTAYDEILAINAQLSASEERFTRLSTEAPFVIYRMSIPDGRYIYVSDSAELVLGYTPQECYDNPLLVKTILHPAFHQLFTDEWNRILAGECAPVYEYQIIHKSGATRWLYQKNVLLKDATGTVTGIEGIIFDMTDRRQAEEALLESEARYRLLVNQSPYTIAIHQHGVVVYVNDYAIRMMGATSPGDLIGKPISQIVHPDGLEAAQNRIKRMLEGETGLYPTLDRYVRLDGSIVPVEVFAAPFIFNGQQAIQVIALDITERLCAEKMLKVTNQKLQLMNIVAWHDIQNKITGVRGYVELSKDLVKDERAIRFLNAEEEVLKVIHQQIAYTQEYQQMGLKPPQWISIPDAIRNLRMNVQLGQIELSVAVDDLEIFSDPVIERVFVHLVDNSIKHGQTVTGIRLSYVESPAGLTLIYEDNGVGIPEGKRRDLFSKSFGKTTGFDLFFVHDLLEISGMGISENGKPGEGARFEITVPKEAYRFVPGRR